MLAALPGWQLRGEAVECPVSSGFAVAATPTSATSVSLFWQAPPSHLPIAIYALFRGTSPSNLAQIGTTATPFFTDVELQPATTYLYVVHAVSSGRGVYGGACPTTPPLPNPPSDITATPKSPTEVTLSWAEKIDPNSLAISEFRIYAGTSPSNLTEVFAGKKVSVTLNVPAGTAYYLVEAIDVDGDVSPAPATVQVTMPNR